MRIAFFGSPAVALPVLEALQAAGHAVVLAVTQPDRPAGRGRRLTPSPVKEYALARGIPVYQPERIRKDPEAVERLRRAAPDVNIVVAFGQIMPGPVIDYPRYRSLNIHFSILPRYRGASPVAWAIRRGETRTGVTIFRLNEKMDEGDVFATLDEGIRPDDTADSLEDRLASLGASLLVRTLETIDGIAPAPQNHALATLAPKLKKEDGRIDWNLAADEVGRHVRAMTSWPSAYTFLNGKRLIVWAGRPEPSAPPSEARPGTVLETQPALIAACAAGTFYRIESLQPEGRARMAAGSFVAGGKIKAGDVLESEEPPRLR